MFLTKTIFLLSYISILTQWVTMDMYCIVYDITNRASFKNCAVWLEQLSQSRGDHNVFGKEIRFVFLLQYFLYSGVLIGNKTDKENYRVVSTQEGKQLATSRKMGFFECSAVSCYFVLRF
jgi:GTPase SAR1 family protein